MPRFTSLVGPASGTTVYYTDPVPAREFASAFITAWRGASPAGSQALMLQESPDLLTWLDKGSVDISTTQSVTAFATIETDWIRLKVSLTDGARFSSWVVGDFALRGV